MQKFTTLGKKPSILSRVLLDNIGLEETISYLRCDIFDGSRTMGDEH